MTISLGGVALSPDMIWSDKFQSSPVAQTVQRTLGGTLVYHTSSLEAGRPITLEARQDMGWLTETQVEALAALAAIPGNKMTLIINSDSYQVIFRHESPPALDFTPLVEGREPSLYYRGVLKLLTV